MLIRRIGKVILIGTVHVSERDIREVRDLILREKPQIVGVELCEERYSALSNGRIAPPASFFGLILYLLQQMVSRIVGVETGSEMIVAVKTAQEAGAKVIFLDMGIDRIVLNLSKLPTLEKMKFLLLLLNPFLYGRKADLSVSSDEFIERLLMQLKKICPGLFHVLVEKRNIHMAEKILEVLPTCEKMVCVVGAGHLPGLASILQQRWRYETSFYVPC